MTRLRLCSEGVTVLHKFTLRISVKEDDTEDVIRRCLDVDSLPPSD